MWDKATFTKSQFKKIISLIFTWLIVDCSRAPGHVAMPLSNAPNAGLIPAWFAMGAVEELTQPAQPVLTNAFVAEWKQISIITFQSLVERLIRTVQQGIN